MAAYASLSSLAKTIRHLRIFLKTQDLESSTSISLLVPDDEYDEEQQLRKEIGYLVGNMNFLRSFLERNHRRIIMKNMIILEARIRDASDKAEDVIGSFLSEQHRSMSCHQHSKFDDNDDEAVVPVMPQRKVDFTGLCHQLHKLRIDEISFLVDDINNIIGKLIGDDAADDTKNNDSSSSSRQIEPTSSAEVVGHYFVSHQLKYTVIGESPELKVIPIVGKGGMGKTTLARIFFDEPLTWELFQICGWVTVSKDYSARDILLSLAKSIQPFIREPMQRYESLENYLQKNLKGRRFFIVLDDVWSVETLNLLMRIFPDDNNGSRILLTTRLKEVALRANPREEMHHRMSLLTWIQSRDLLERKVFNRERCPDELENYLRAIVSRCGGWPLLIVLVAGILRTIGKSELEWSKTATILLSLRIDGDDDESGSRMFDKILLYSYGHLPHRLRSCLMYMGAFPEDHEITASKLTKLWLAHGLLHESSSASSSPESESCYRARECLHQLVHRNLVSVVNWKSDGNIKSCSLHDIVREFCLRKARQEGFFRYVTDNYDDDDLTRKRMQTAYGSNSLKRICDTSADNTHTIICFGSGRSALLSIGRFRLLKTFDAMNIELKAFPLEVVELFLLRLLAISHVPELPSSISNLRYLETLTVHTMDALPGSLTLPSIVCLPCEIWTMPMLKHIVSMYCGVLPDPEGNCSSLENLETLSSVMNLDCSEDTLKLIPNVKKLGIFYYGVGRATHSLENLERLHRLEKLKLCVMVPFSSPQNLDLGFPVTLKKLNLRGVHLSSRDMTVIGRLPTLRLLKLRRSTFDGDEWIINHGEFPQLESLLLEDLADLRRWASSDEVTFLPMLQLVVVRGCTRLSEVPRCVVHVLVVA